MRFFVNYIATSLMLLALAVSSVFAQTDNIPFQKVRIADEPVSKTFKSNSQTKQTRDENVYWSCDFEDGSPIPTLTKSDDSETDWQIITEADYPDEMFTSAGSCYFLPMNYTGHEGNTDPNQQISETPGHWAFVDACSDIYASAPAIDVNMTFSGINLSSCAMPKIRFIQSWKALNQSSEHIYIMVSTDGGTTWTEHIINDENLDSYTYVNGIKEVLIPEAGNAAEVSIRFRYVSEIGSWHYGWQIDDIKIIEIPEHNLTINDARISMFGYVDYRDEELLSIEFPQYNYTQAREFAYQEYDPYAQSPKEQWETERGYAAFNVEYTNNGTATVAPKVNIIVTSPSGAELYNKTLNGSAIALSQRDTIDFGTIDDNNTSNSTVFYFEGEPELGRYTVTFTISEEGAEDANPEDNTTVQYFDITDKNFSKSYFEPTTSACISCYTNSTSGGDEYGTNFTYYYSPDDIMSVDVYVNSRTTPGTSIKVKIYGITGGTHYLVRESAYHEITETDMDSWINFTFDDYNISFEEETYRSVYVMVSGIWNSSSDNIYLGASNVLTSRSHDSYMRLGYDTDTDGEPNWYYGAQDLAITLHAGEGVNPGVLSTHTITVLSANESRGYVSGGGTFANGTQTTISATPYDGYRFTSWNDGNIENPRTITVDADATFIATFAPCPIYEVDTAVNYVLTHNGHTYYADGDYEFVYPNETGCDSIVMMHLHIIYSVDEYEIIEATIFPNPVDNILNITSQENISAVEILSVAGQLLLSLKPDSQNVVCDVNNLTQGIYFVKIYGADGKIPAIKKFVKE